jgi:hypothetical protein
MRILVSEPMQVDDLVAFLRRCECAADRVGERYVEAVPSHSEAEFAYLRMELDAYLRVWREMHPGVIADLLDSTTVSSA